MEEELNNSARMTRGSGLLEGFLASLRAKKANHLIPDELRAGRILDIGCGSYPYFLSHTAFKEKFAIDQLHPQVQFKDINWHQIDLHTEPKLPFEDNFFSVVTLLAVIEHLDPGMIVKLFQEIHRVLQPGGVVIITTPASWSDGLLHMMAHFNLVSHEEISEHKYAYTLPLLGWYFGSAGFAMTKIRFGYFEMIFNLWATAEK